VKGTTGPAGTGAGRAQARDLGCWVERAKAIEPSLRAWEAPDVRETADQIGSPTAPDCALRSGG
jgi:hypothetical protein